MKILTIICASLVFSLNLFSQSLDSLSQYEFGNIYMLEGSIIALDNDSNVCVSFKDDTTEIYIAYLSDKIDTTSFEINYDSIPEPSGDTTLKMFCTDLFDFISNMYSGKFYYTLDSGQFVHINSELMAYFTLDSLTAEQNLQLDNTPFSTLKRYHYSLEPESEQFALISYQYIDIIQGEKILIVGKSSLNFENILITRVNMLIDKYELQWDF